jgi:Cupin superfamily protein
MTLIRNLDIGRLEIPPDIVERSFNREPFGFNHNLNQLDMFELESLAQLAAKQYGQGCEQDFFLASSATAPDQKFRAVESVNLELAEAFRSLKEHSIRILLKRPENHDARFRKLRDGVVEQILDRSAELRNDRILRLESAIFITSATTLTPFHFDPSAVFFCQILGEKTYHLYSPTTLTEPELEQFYFRGMVDIAQVELTKRDPTQEHVFRLSAGNGLHQPQNAPHWVETQGDISVSYSFFFETQTARKINRTRGFNHYLRMAGAQPEPPGLHPSMDALKAEAMNVWIPCRRTLSYVKSATVGSRQP